MAEKTKKQNGASDKVPTTNNKPSSKKRVKKRPDTKTFGSDGVMYAKWLVELSPML